MMLAHPRLNAQIKVPAIGCSSDGQMGPIKAPRVLSKSVSIALKIARNLAYYRAADGLGVLAPKGWHCFQAYGSNGQTLYVSPAVIDSKALFTPHWKGMTGSAVVLSTSFGGTSGRFEVAEVAARVFPAYRRFVDRVVAEGFAPASSFPSGSYPNDEISYKSKSLIEYRTPPNREGLGMRGGLQKNDTSVSGAAIILDSDTDLIQVSVRFHPAMNSLSKVIIQQFERDAVKPPD